MIHEEYEPGPRPAAGEEPGDNSVATQAWKQEQYEQQNAQEERRQLYWPDPRIVGGEEIAEGFCRIRDHGCKIARSD
jgi:hypothetical protein